MMEFVYGIIYLSFFLQQHMNSVLMKKTEATEYPPSKRRPTFTGRVTTHNLV